MKLKNSVTDFNLEILGFKVHDNKFSDKYKAHFYIMFGKVHLGNVTIYNNNTIDIYSLTDTQYPLTCGFDILLKMFQLGYIEESEEQ